MKFFDHDCDAHKDAKILRLRKKHGGAAVDAYYTMLEMIYESEHAIAPALDPMGYGAIAIYLMCEEEELAAWVDTMCETGLLSCDTDQDGVAWLDSPRAQDTIERYKSRKLTARENGKKGGRPRKTDGGDGGSDDNRDEPEQNQDGDSQNQNEPNENPEKPNGFSDKPNETKTKPNESKENQWQTKPNPAKPEEEVEGEVDIQEKKKDKKEKERAELKERLDFIAEVLRIYNEETNSDILQLDDFTRHNIDQIRMNGRTLDDVRLVTRHRFAEWKDNPAMNTWIAPKTFYGKKFEDYLSAARRDEQKRASRSERGERLAKYA